MSAKSLILYLILCQQHQVSPPSNITSYQSTEATKKKRPPLEMDLLWVSGVYPVRCAVIFSWEICEEQTHRRRMDYSQRLRPDEQPLN